MRFDILTLFPDMFTGPLTESILKRAVQTGKIHIELHDIRAHASDKHHTADDAPYGGGAGMVMKAEPLAAAIRSVVRGPWSVASSRASEPVDEAGLLEQDEQRTTNNGRWTLVILMSPAGERFTQSVAHELAAYDRLVLVCGHYEGIHERVREALIDRELSIGEESYGGGLLEYPHYTRPAVWEGRAVPQILLSGHHGQVAQWRRQQQLRRTLERRPDLLKSAELTTADRNYLRSLGWSPENHHELA